MTVVPAGVRVVNIVITFFAAGPEGVHEKASLQVELIGRKLSSYF